MDDIAILGPVGVAVGAMAKAIHARWQAAEKRCRELQAELDDLKKQRIADLEDQLRAELERRNEVRKATCEIPALTPEDAHALVADMPSDPQMLKAVLAEVRAEVTRHVNKIARGT